MISYDNCEKYVLTHFGIDVLYYFIYSFSSSVHSFIDYSSRCIHACIYFSLFVFEIYFCMHSYIHVYILILLFIVWFRTYVGENTHLCVLWHTRALGTAAWPSPSARSPPLCPRRCLLLLTTLDYYCRLARHLSLYSLFSYSYNWPWERWCVWFDTGECAHCLVYSRSLARRPKCRRRERESGVPGESSSAAVQPIHIHTVIIYNVDNIQRWLLLYIYIHYHCALIDWLIN